MKLEVGQVWSYRGSNFYTILKIEAELVEYEFCFNTLETKHLNKCNIDAFLDAVNANNGYVLLTDLTKALI